MIDLNERCPICGSDHSITTNSVATARTTIINDNYIKVDNINASKIWCSTPYEVDQTKLNTIKIECKTITLKQGEIEITFDLDRQLKDYESITINGVKFKRIDEE